jgi:hypothetical protein
LLIIVFKRRGRVIKALRFKNVHSLAELHKVLEMIVIRQRQERRFVELERELMIEELGVSREGLRYVYKQDVNERPRKAGGGESTGERKDMKTLMKRCRAKRYRESLEGSWDK